MNDPQMANGSTDRLERKIDALTDTVGRMDTRLGRVEEELGGVKQELGGAKQELGGVQHELGAVKQGLEELGNRVTKVYILAEQTDRFAKDAWDSLESLRTNVAKGFEEAKKEREQGLQLVHFAIRQLGEKVQRIEEAPSRARNREL